MLSIVARTSANTHCGPNLGWCLAQRLALETLALLATVTSLGSNARCLGRDAGGELHYIANAGPADGHTGIIIYNIHSWQLLTLTSNYGRAVLEHAPLLQQQNYHPS